MNKDLFADVLNAFEEMTAENNESVGQTINANLIELVWFPTKDTNQED